MVNGARLFFTRLFNRKVNVKTIPILVPNDVVRGQIQQMQDQRKMGDAIQLMVGSSTGLLPQEIAKLSNEDLMLLVDRITRAIRLSDAKRLGLA